MVRRNTERLRNILDSNAFVEVFLCKGDALLNVVEGLFAAAKRFLARVGVFRELRKQNVKQQQSLALRTQVRLLVLPRV